MQGSGLAVRRPSRAAWGRLVEAIGKDMDDHEGVQRRLVDAFLEERLSLADYRLFIDHFTE